MNDMPEEGTLVPMAAESGMVALLNKSEIDQQITTAHRFPRSIKAFRNEALQMVTLSEGVAQECFYALPRDGKVIEGPSARFAEIIASAWGNCRAGARVVSDQGDFVTAQGVFHDLQRNVAITYEVQRRIVDKRNKRYGVDMIGVTGNAACSVALRNAILKGVPKAFWSELYTAARKTAVGDVKSIATKRANAIAQFQVYGVGEAQILARLGRAGVEDVTIDDLVILLGLFNAIKDGDTTPEQAFSADDAPARPVEMPQAKAKPSAPQADAAPASSEPGVESPPAAAEQESTEVTPGNALKPGQVRVIEAKMKAAGLTEIDFTAKWGKPLCGADEFPNFRAAQANDILAWVNEKAGA